MGRSAMTKELDMSTCLLLLSYVSIAARKRGRQTKVAGECHLESRRIRGCQFGPDIPSSSTWSHQCVLHLAEHSLISTQSRDRPCPTRNPPPAMALLYDKEQIWQMKGHFEGRRKLLEELLSLIDLSACPTLYWPVYKYVLNISVCKHLLACGYLNARFLFRARLLPWN